MRPWVRILRCAQNDNAGGALDPAIAARIQPWFPDLDLATVRVEVSARRPAALLTRLLRARASALLPAPVATILPRHYDPAAVATWALLAHECEHICQRRTLGWWRWSARYWSDRLALLARRLPEVVRTRNLYAGYAELPLERPAIEIERAVRAFYSG